MEDTRGDDAEYLTVHMIVVKSQNSQVSNNIHIWALQLRKRKTNTTNNVKC